MPNFNKNHLLSLSKDHNFKFIDKSEKELTIKYYVSIDSDVFIIFIKAFTFDTDERNNIYYVDSRKHLKKISLKL